jgi:arabinan endo-1,5-alpha-L-arabinosidase
MGRPCGPSGDRFGMALWGEWIERFRTGLMPSDDRLSAARILGMMGSSLLASVLILTLMPKAHLGQSVRGDYVHDPSMIRAGDTFYVFSTGDPSGIIGDGNIQIRRSTDLRHWRYLGTIFERKPAWVPQKVRSLWAPDVSYYRGRYQVYYSASIFGTNDSAIGLATNETLDPNSPRYRWVDRGVVIRSTPADDWNAIDPSFTVDADGQPWLVFGSFWSGIKMVKLNPETGKLAEMPPRLYSLAYRPDPPHAIEAPSLIYRKPYYYLFVSFDFCCRRARSTYNIRVGRAKSITGPYLDRSGKPMMQGGGTLILSNSGEMIGPGGQAIYHDGDTYYLVHHFYDASDSGRAKLQIHRLLWTSDGWPRVGPAIISYGELRQSEP